MKHRVYGYGISLPHHPTYSLARQMENVRDYVALHKDELNWDADEAWISDIITCRSAAFLKRPGGEGLFIQATQQDHVVVGSMVAFKTLPRITDAIEKLATRGVTLAIADWPLIDTLFNPGCVELVRQFVEFDATAGRLAGAVPPPYGWVWKQNAYRETVMVENYQEREVADKIFAAYQETKNWRVASSGVEPYFRGEGVEAHAPMLWFVTALRYPKVAINVLKERYWERILEGESVDTLISDFNQQRKRMFEKSREAFSTGG